MSTRAFHRSNRIARRAFALATALLLGLALGLPAPAATETRSSDIVLGETAEERGIDAAELPDVSAPRAIVVSQDGTTYYERDADTPVRIASITKVMTAIVALDNAELTDTITVDHAAATVGEASAHLLEGDTMTLETALTALIVASGNDAAMAIASSVGALIDPQSDNPYQTFIDAMNDKAAELGMTNSLFENPHGLDFNGWEGNLHSTARDVAIMFAYGMKNEAFRAIVSSTATSITVTAADGTQRSCALDVHNRILGQEGNIGGKTGTTYESLSCFVGAFSQETGGEIYTVVLGAADDTARFADTLALSNWYYGHIATVPLANTPVSSGDMPVIAQAACSDWTDKTVGVTLEDPTQTATVFSLAGALEQHIEVQSLGGSVERGQEVGTITFTQGDEVVAEATLVAAADQPGPSVFEWFMVQFDRLVRFFQGQAGEAETVVLNEAPDPLAYDAA